MLRNGNNVVILLKPTFGNELDENDQQIEIEYGSLPNNVKDEVLDFFNSDEFLLDQAQDYALSQITANPSPLTYPGFNTKINDIEFKLEDDVLLVYLYGTLVQIPPEELENFSGKQTILRYQPVTSEIYKNNIKEGFYKASHSGPLTPEYGNYLGEFGERYMIYLNYDRINSYII